MAGGGGGKVHTGFWWGNLGERDRLEDPSVDGRIIVRKWDWGGGRFLAWLDRVQNRDRWRPLVNSVINLRVP